MKLTHGIAGLLLGAVWPGLARSQTYQPKDECAYLSSKRIFHFVGDTQPLQAEELKDLPLTQRATPVKPAAPHPIEVAESERAYADGRLTDAAEAVAKAAALISPDP